MNLQEMVNHAILEIIENEKPFNKIVVEMHEDFNKNDIKVFDFHAKLKRQLLNLIVSDFITDNENDIKRLLQLFITNKSEIDSELNLLMNR